MNRSKTEQRVIPPDDAYNRTLVDNVHPPTWTNPSPTGPYNLVVLGAGTAGLVTAAVAAGLGAKVALIERELMGGDCLNVGSYPRRQSFAPHASALRSVRRASSGSTSRRACAAT